MNIDAINKTIAAITAAAPERFQMSMYFIGMDYGKPRSVCRTAACIAGWVVLANKKITTPAGLSNLQAEFAASHILTGQGPSTINRAMGAKLKALFLMWELDREESPDDAYYTMLKRFGVSNEDLQGALSSFDALAPAIRKQAAINVLTTLRDTGEVDWITAIEKAGEEVTKQA